MDEIKLLIDTAANLRRAVDIQGQMLEVMAALIRRVALLEAERAGSTAEELQDEATY